MIGLPGGALANPRTSFCWFEPAIDYHLADDGLFACDTAALRARLPANGAP